MGIVRYFDQHGEILTTQEGVLINDPAALIRYFQIDLCNPVRIVLDSIASMLGEFRKHQVKRHCWVPLIEDDCERLT